MVHVRDPCEPAGLYSDPTGEEVRAAHRRPASRPSPPRCARASADRSTRAPVGEYGHVQGSGAGTSPRQSVGIEWVGQLDAPCWTGAVDRLIRG